MIRALTLGLLSLALLSPIYAQSSTGVCSNQAPINITAAGAATTQIIPAFTSQAIRICHISFSASAAANFSLVQGKGTNCSTAQSSITGPYQNVITLSLTPGPVAGPFASSGNAVCLVISAATNIGGVVTWAAQ